MRTRSVAVVGAAAFASLAFILLAPVIEGPRFGVAHFVATPTCLQLPCRLVDPGNASVGYMYVDRQVNVTVYESLGYAYGGFGAELYTGNLEYRLDLAMYSLGPPASVAFRAWVFLLVEVDLSIVFVACLAVVASRRRAAMKSA